MTHKDIYTKFMIEYDKANVTSSYPSFTKYESASLLNKAYLALIAQKVTGNNVRRSGFESDVKSVSDIQPLVKHDIIELESTTEVPAVNIITAELPKDFMFFVQLSLALNTGKPYDGEFSRGLPVKLVSHNMAEGFFSTPYNMPWVKNPVCYILNETIYIVYDPINKPTLNGRCFLSYVRTPNKFTIESDDLEFELSDSMAEELVTLAISFALENIESPRLNSNLSMRRLEA